MCIRDSSYSALFEAAFSLIERNKWEKVAVLYGSDASSHLHQRLRDTISRELEKNRIVFHSVVYDTYLPHDALNSSSAKVIIVLTGLSHAQKLLCIAHERKMVFPRYQWVITGYSFHEFMGTDIAFHYGGMLYNCSKNKHEILQDHVFLSFSIDNVDKSTQLVSGYTYYDTLRQYLQKVSSYNNENEFRPSILPSIWATITYDAVWALVLALNMSTINGSFHCGNEMFTKDIKDCLDVDKIKFDGVSGNIEFDSATGYTPRIVDISIGVNVVGFSSRGNISILTDNPRIFINTTVITTTETVHLSVSILFLFIILILSTATFLLHILSTINRRHPSIKASSPILSHFIFFGCYVWTAAAIIYILVVKTLSFKDDDTCANSCNAIWVWLIPVGWTLTFGTLIAKTWRIYRIFVHFRDPGCLISNKVLITLVLLQLGFDITLGTVWSIISPIKLHKNYIEVTNTENSNMVSYVTELWCVFTSNGLDYFFWIVILYGYKVLQVSSLFVLTLLTRKVPNRKFNTFFLRRASYLSFVSFVSLVPTFTVLWYLNAEIHADFVIMCVLISANISICLAFVLLPPALPLLKQLCSRLFN